MKKRTNHKKDKELLPLLESPLVCEYRGKSCKDWTGQMAVWSLSSHWGLTRHCPETCYQKKRLCIAIGVARMHI